MKGNNKVLPWKITKHYGSVSTGKVCVVASLKRGAMLYGVDTT